MLKRILLAALMWPLVALGQTFTYPSVTFQNLTVLGTITGGSINLGPQAANTVLANATGSSAAPTPVALPSCSATGNALGYTSATGFTCFTGYAPLASPAFTGTPTAPTAALGTNTTQIATTAFVANRGPCANIMDFGGNNAGGANNDTAYTNALAASSNTSTEKCVYFPPGRFNFASQAGFTFSASHSSVTIIGSGQETTTLYWAANGGLGFSYHDCTDSVTVQGLSLLAGGVNTGSGISLAQAGAGTQSCAISTIRDVTARDVTNYFGTNYFQYGVIANGVSDVNLDNVNIIGPSGTPGGVGAQFQGTSSQAAIVYNVVNSAFDNLAYGLYYGNYVQGVQVSNSNFTNDTNAIYVPAGESGLDQLTVSNSQFNSVTNGFNIYLLSGISNVNISNNTFLINNSSSGVNLQNGSGLTTIVGNTFSPNTGSPSNVYGVVINGWTVGGTMVSGNNFYNLTTGVALQSGSKNVNVQSNVYQSCSANTSNTGTGNVIGGGSP